jgi:hypothetical protein
VIEALENRILQLQEENAMLKMGHFTMDGEQAKRLVAMMTEHAFYTQGIIDKQPQNISGFTLAEMLYANRYVENLNKNAKPDPAGKKTIQLVCDDRLIAAIYVLYHYGYSIPIRPIVIMDGRCVCIAPVSESEDEE